VRFSFIVFDDAVFQIDFLTQDKPFLHIDVYYFNTKVLVDLLELDKISVEFRHIISDFFGLSSESITIFSLDFNQNLLSDVWL